MNPITPFNNWVICKIQAFLHFKEGFNVVREASYTPEGTKLVVQDAFGYQYEVHVRMLGRVITETEDTGYVR